MARGNPVSRTRSSNHPSRITRLPALNSQPKTLNSPLAPSQGLGRPGGCLGWHPDFESLATRPVTRRGRKIFTPHTRSHGGTAAAKIIIRRIDRLSGNTRCRPAEKCPARPAQRTGGVIDGLKYALSPPSSQPSRWEKEKP